MKKLLSKTDTLIFLISLILIGIISYATTLYGDDFIYGTYFCNGASGFFTKTAEHYMQMNGRALIHFVLELVLVFKDKLFFAVIPAMLIFVFYAFNRILPQKEKMPYFALCLSGVMLIPVSVLREGMLWMSGAFNYIFPLGLALIGFWTVKEQREKTPWYFFLFAFISGASTEQCGMIAIGSSILYVLYELTEKRKIEKNTYILILLILLGFLSVALSPGTSGRIGEETLNAQLSITDRLYNVFKLSLSDKKTAFILVFAPFLCSLQLKNIWISVFTAAAFVFSLFGFYLIAGLLLTTGILIISVILLVKTDKSILAILLLASAGSLGMLVFSTTFGYRNLMPSLLLMTAISAYEMNLIIRPDTKKALIICIAFIISAISFLPTLRGYISNRQIINANIKSITKDNEIYYNTDINQLYGYNQFFVDNFYFDGIKQIYGINKDTKIFMQGHDFIDLFFNGVHTENPIYIKDNSYYYPLRGIIEASNGSADWDNQRKCAVFTLNNKTLYVDMTNAHLFNDESDYPADYFLIDSKYGNFFRSNIYLSEKAFEDIWGINLGEN